MSELGKIEKTIFLLEYAINEDLRKVITQMLNRRELFLIKVRYTILEKRLSRRNK